MEQKSIRVQIYGSEYPLKVDDEQFTTQAAAELDRMMVELHSKLPDQPPLVLAVLSALNISEELALEKREKQRLIEMIDEEIASVSKLIETGV
jgi:cell division protein ZapA (FtsZ GTPase activity inhibitor)